MTAAALLVVAAAAARAEIAEKIVAKVGRDIITRSELQDAMAAAAAPAKPPTGAAGDKVAREVLDRLVAERLVVQEAEGEGLRVTDAEVGPQVDAEVDAVRTRFKTEGEFTAQLRKEGLTLEDLRLRFASQIKDRYAYLKMLGRKRREFETGADVSEEEIRTYYQAHQTEAAWMTAPEIHARHIQFNVDATLTGTGRAEAVAAARRKADAARAALKRGESFAAVAKRVSEDPVTRDAGGDLGTFARGTYHESLERAAFAAKPGAVTGPVESPAGLHLILVEEAVKPHLKGLDDAVSLSVSGEGGVAPEGGAAEGPLRDQIRVRLKTEKMSKALQDWIASLRSRASVQLLPD